MYQKLQQKYQTSESKLYFDASLLLRVSREWLNMPSIILYILYTKPEAKSKFTGHGLSRKPRIKQGFIINKNNEPS